MVTREMVGERSGVRELREIRGTMRGTESRGRRETMTREEEIVAMFFYPFRAVYSLHPLQ